MFGFEIVNEAIRGTLEQLSMSPMGIWRILSTRLIASTIIYGIIIFVLLIITMLTAGQWLNIDILSIFPIFVLTVFGMYGVGLMVGGLAIVYKQIQAFLQILQFLLAGLTFIPLAASPLMYFLPFVIGVDLVRDIMIDGQTLINIGWLPLTILFINAFVYFVAGLLFFNYCERMAMKKDCLVNISTKKESSSIRTALLLTLQSTFQLCTAAGTSITAANVFHASSRQTGHVSPTSEPIVTFVLSNS